MSWWFHIYYGFIPSQGILQRPNFSASPANIDLASASIISLVGSVHTEFLVMNGFWYPGVVCDCSRLLPGLQSPPPPPFLCSLTPLSQTSATLQSTPWHILRPGPFSIFPGCFWCTHSVHISFQCQVGSAIGSHLPALHQGFPWLLPTVLSVPAYRQETSHFCSTFGFCLCQYSWLLMQTHCIFFVGAAWNKGKSDYFCSLGVGHVLNRSKMNFLHVIFCTASSCGGWKQHFYIPGMENCSLNHVWVAGLKQRRPALFSSCSWGDLATSTEKEKEKEIISTGEGVEFENTLFSCHKKWHTYTTLHIHMYLTGPWQERGVGC